MWKLEKHTKSTDLGQTAHLPIYCVKPVFIGSGNTRLRNIVDFDQSPTCL